MLHFTHALVLTPFESSLVPLQWDEVVAQDFTVHLLYCDTTNSVIFHSDSRDFDCTERVSFLFETLSKIGTEFTYGQQIVILRDDESEYNAEDVLRHLKQ